MRGIAIVLLLVVLLVPGCTYNTENRDGYTRAEVDAMNIEAACKAQARSLLQVARCETRRR